MKQLFTYLTEANTKPIADELTKLGVKKSTNGFDAGLFYYTNMNNIIDVFVVKKLSDYNTSATLNIEFTDFNKTATVKVYFNIANTSKYDSEQIVTSSYILDVKDNRFDPFDTTNKHIDSEYKYDYDKTSEAFIKLVKAISENLNNITTEFDNSFKEKEDTLVDLLIDIYK